MRRRRSLRLVGALALVAVVATGCSDDGDEGPGGEAAAPTSSTTTVVFTGDPASPFCTLLRDVELQGLLDDQVASPTEVEAAFTAVLDALERVAEASPPELAEDTALVLVGMAALDDALRAAGYSYDALVAEPGQAVEVSRAANDPAFAVASARIEAYKEQVCRL